MATRRRQPETAARGASLVELLLATALFGLAVLAAAPLFARAVLDVRTGAERSAAAALAGSGLEAASPAAFPPPGATVTRIEYLSFEERRWIDSPPVPPDRALWVREAVLRFYPLSALADGRLDRAEAAAPPAGGPPAVGLVGIEVRVGRRAGGRPLAWLERIEWAHD